MGYQHSQQIRANRKPQFEKSVNAKIQWRRITKFYKLILTITQISWDSEYVRGVVVQWTANAEQHNSHWNQNSQDKEWYKVQLKS